MCIRDRNLAVKSGRLAHLAGRMEKKYYADASSPLNQISKIK
jgi:thiazole synthase ThiGH ThiG subunit